MKTKYARIIAGVPALCLAIVATLFTVSVLRSNTTPDLTSVPSMADSEVVASGNIAPKSTARDWQEVAGSTTKRTGWK
jgi:hypothetical protein